jgi:hypothetical protein
MIVRPWQIGDTAKIEIQDDQQYLSNIIDMNRDLTYLSEANLLWTFVQDTRIMAVMDLEPQWEGRAVAWALISKHIGKHFAFVHKYVDNFITCSGFRRVEATVDVGFEQGHRWMRMLGFELEGYMRAYRPDGKDMILYSKVRF